MKRKPDPRLAVDIAAGIFRNTGSPAGCGRSSPPACNRCCARPHSVPQSWGWRLTPRGWPRRREPPRPSTSSACADPPLACRLAAWRAALARCLDSIQAAMAPQDGTILTIVSQGPGHRPGARAQRELPGRSARLQLGRQYQRLEPGAGDLAYLAYQDARRSDAMRDRDRLAARATRAGATCDPARERQGDSRQAGRERVVALVRKALAYVARRLEHQLRGRVPALELRPGISVAWSNCVRRSGILSWEQPINNSGPAAPIRFTLWVQTGVPCFAKSARRRGST